MANALVFFWLFGIIDCIFLTIELNHMSPLTQPKFLHNLKRRLDFSNKSWLSQLLILFGVGLAFTAVVAGMLGYKIGIYRGMHTAAVIAQDAEGGALTTMDIQSMRLENKILKNEALTLTQERDISLNNLSLVREELRALKTEYEQLQLLNEALMKSSVQEGSRIPLKILSAQILPFPGDVFEYHFSVAMLERDGRSRTLRPKLLLLNATQMVEIPLQPATYELKGLSHISGRFLMPEDFKPKQMKLVLSVDGKHLEQLYNWKSDYKSNQNSLSQ